MIILIFGILMCMVFGKLLFLAIKATWGITRILFSIVFLPVILIGIFIAGFYYLAFILLIIAGIIALII